MATTERNERTNDRPTDRPSKQINEWTNAENQVPVDAKLFHIGAHMKN